MADTPLIGTAARLGLAELAPGVLTQLAAGQLVAPTQNLPVVNTRVGSLFEDRFDPGLRWYLPTFILVNDPDPAFAFDADQVGVGADGEPFNRAVLTIDLRPGDPPDLAQARAAGPGLTFRAVPLTINATLNLPYTANDGAPQIVTAAGQVSPQPDGTQRLTFNLLGPDVIIAYQNLTQLAGATITLVLTYDAWQKVSRTIRHPAADVERVDPSELPNPRVRPQSAQFTRAILTPPDGASADSQLSRDLVVPDHGALASRVVAPPLTAHIGLVPSGTFMPPGGWVVETVEYYVSTTGQDTQTVSLGPTFQADAYRPRFTIALSGTKRPIIDITDLAQFATRRSEFRELTSLGDVQTRYPSFRRLYLGQVSGTVVAIPTSYAIVRGSSGTAIHCEAALDPSPTSVSGCRFQFTFTLAPAIDPIDLAQVALDLPGIPEASGRTLQLTLPSGLDPRTPSTLNGFAAATAAFSDGVDPHSLLAEVTIADDRATPAITNVNLFLNQLTTSVTAPVFGTIAVRLDDTYPTPVQTSAVLNLRSTAGSDDVVVSVADTPPAARATNHAPFAVQLLRSAVLAEHTLAVTPLDATVVSAGETTTLPGNVSDAAVVLVGRTLALPTPLPKAALFNYIDFHTTTVQQSQHAMTIDARGVDFATAGISQLDIQLQIANLPSVPVPSLTLTPSHMLDFVHVLVPVDAVLTGLAATVTITVTGSAGARDVSLAHDFLEDPTLSLNTSQLT